MSSVVGAYIVAPRQRWKGPLFFFRTFFSGLSSRSLQSLVTKSPLVKHMEAVVVPKYEGPLRFRTLVDPSRLVQASTLHTQIYFGRELLTTSYLEAILTMDSEAVTVARSFLLTEPSTVYCCNCLCEDGVPLVGASVVEI